MINTIRKVMMVVLVLIISCQVSEKPNNGPLKAQIIRSATAATKIQAWPMAFETALVKRVKISGFR
jgi:hypothetical protein